MHNLLGASRNMMRLVACGLLALAFCLGLAGCQENEAGGQGLVRIATKPMTEQFILSEMLALIIEKDTGLRVEITKGIGGGTANIHPALVKGDFDMYPEYTGTAWTYVLKKEGFPPDDALLEEVKKEYAQRYNLAWTGMYGFNNTFGLVVHKAVAEAHGLRAISDLAPHAGALAFGAEYDFYEREDGFDALCKAYGLRFLKHVDLDIGLKYPAINARQIDVMNVFTTDGQIAVSDTVLLADDRHFYNTYYCGTVVRAATLEKYPELNGALLKMENILTEADMARLNHEVEGKGRGDREVAKEFLESKGLL